MCVTEDRSDTHNTYTQDGSHLMYIATTKITLEGAQSNKQNRCVVCVCVCVCMSVFVHVCCNMCNKCNTLQNSTIL